MQKTDKTPEEIFRIREYQRNYQSNRYQTDPEFRKKKLEYNLRYINKIGRENFNKKNLERYHELKPKNKNPYLFSEVIFEITSDTHGGFGRSINNRLDRVVEILPEGSLVHSSAIAKAIGIDVKSCGLKLSKRSDMENQGNSIWEKVRKTC